MTGLYEINIVQVSAKWMVQNGAIQDIRPTVISQKRWGETIAFQSKISWFLGAKRYESYDATLTLFHVHCRGPPARIFPFVLLPCPTPFRHGAKDVCPASSEGGPSQWCPPRTHQSHSWWLTDESLARHWVIIWCISWNPNNCWLRIFYKSGVFVGWWTHCLFWRDNRYTWTINTSIIHFKLWQNIENTKN